MGAAWALLCNSPARRIHASFNAKVGALYDRYELFQAYSLAVVLLIGPATLEFCRYFVRSERASFHHQLHQYGFARLTLGQDAGSFYHEHFLRGNPTLAEYMGRVYTPQIGHRDNCESVQTVGYNALVHRAPAHSVSYASFESQTWTNTAISKVEARFADNEDDTGTAALSALEDVIDKVFFDRDGVEDDMLCDFCGEWSKAL